MAADVKTHLYEWSTTEGSNLPVGSTVVSTNLDDNLRMIQKVVRDLSAPTTLAAGTTTDLGSKDETFITLTGGVATITGLGTVSAGIYKWVVFNDAHVLTHSATDLILPSGANITAASGDVACFVSLGTGKWRCLSYVKASGEPLANTGTFSDGTVSAPSISFLSDTNTGLYLIGADNLGAAVNGVKVVDLAQKTLALTTASSSGACAINGTATGTGVDSSVTLTATSSGLGNGTVVLDGSTSVAMKVAGTALVTASGGATNTNTVTLVGKVSVTGAACTITAGSGIGETISGNATACTYIFGGTGVTTITIGFGSSVTYASTPIVVPSYEGANITIETIPTTTAVTFNLSATSAGGHILRFITIQ